MIVFSVTKSWLTLYDPMDGRTPGFFVPHLPEFDQIYVYLISDAIQPSYPLLPPFPSAFNLSQHQGLFQHISSSHQVSKVLDFKLKHQSVQRKVDFLSDWLVWSPGFPRESQESSPAPQFKSINSLALCLLYCPTVTSIHYYWKDHNLGYTVLYRQSDVFAF